ncbi:hypothetical protein MPTK1_4g11810 [Marchantia polymorpha subsp. ruderalis]|uniref:Uncharacterized protein n=2 Tax=Marchantia polymorpha TaxID=3197 RepID=A0AAF6B8Y5_MARPO|nr:hypothetical protein MARPO_0011s0166 [Marchantia polymorpha]BBN08469.1 hypothetical protein Mp_4g11810 [Marchantia polymorpha subsp. ruderalis]|eukprot:PTQ46505.1 hypothetical protein MARPO_0011s0166 [Marchantia polymorpha]
MLCVRQVVTAASDCAYFPSPQLTPNQSPVPMKVSPLVCLTLHCCRRSPFCSLGSLAPFCSVLLQRSSVLPGASLTGAPPCLPALTDFFFPSPLSTSVHTRNSGR